MSEQSIEARASETFFRDYAKSFVKSRQDRFTTMAGKEGKFVYDNLFHDVAKKDGKFLITSDPSEFRHFQEELEAEWNREKEMILAKQ